MTYIDPKSLWFHTVDTFSLCRGGSNGPQHPSQLYAVEKYMFSEMSFLDYGCGSATTLEALLNHSQFGAINTTNNNEKYLRIKYKGVDIIPKNIEWCKQNFPGYDFEVNPFLHKIDQPDKSWDVVYSRHVVDHMESFEKAMDEHKRVAKRLVIVILWTGFVDSDEHEIKNIVDQRGLPTEKLYPNEYTNNYSRKKVMEYLYSDLEWKLLELNENVGGNQVIVLENVNI